MTAHAAIDSRIAPEPLVIFGTGGSGTRVVAQIARHAGYWMGDHVNESEDALHVAEFLESAVDPYVQRTDWLNRVLRDPRATIDLAPRAAALRQAVERHCSGIPAEAKRWGWKNPRCIFILPLVQHVFPGFRVIHVIRDGRDMAYSSNQNQLDKHGHHLTNIGIGPDRPRHERSIALWSWLNSAAAAYGERQLGERYLRVKFEDLCNTPEIIARQIFDVLGADGCIESAIGCVQRPGSLGRWRRLDSQDRQALTESAREALDAFGYLPESNREGKGETPSFSRAVRSVE